MNYAPFCYIVAPAVEESGGNVEVQFGEMLNVTCTVDGLPRPTLTWLRDDSLLLEVGGRLEVNTLVVEPGFRQEVPTSEAVRSTVVLRDAQASDNGTTFSCRVENGFGELAFIASTYRLVVRNVPGREQVEK